MARRASLSAFVLLISVASASRAHADDVPPTPTSPPPVPPPAPAVFATRPPPMVPAREHEAETTWYGWQTLIADGTSLIALPIAAGTTQSEALLGVAVGGYFLAPPFIHGAHGRWGIFAASLGLRLGMPIGLGLLGAALDDCNSSSSFCIPVGAAIGFVSGVLGAVAIDASALSYETEETSERRRAETSKKDSVAWSPTIAPRKEGGFTLGLGATF